MVGDGELADLQDKAAAWGQMDGERTALGVELGVETVVLGIHGSVDAVNEAFHHVVAVREEREGYGDVALVENA